MIVAGELQQAWVKADVVADPVQDHALEVVVQEDARDPAEALEGQDVRAQETLQGWLEAEASEQRAGPGEDEEETPEGAARVADREDAEVRPVDLALLPGQVVKRRKASPTGRGRTVRT